MSAELDRITRASALSIARPWGEIRAGLNVAIAGGRRSALDDQRLV